MIIHSPFRDYYDGVSGQTDLADAVHYQRQMQFLSEETYGEHLNLWFHSYHYHAPMLATCIAGFCGRLYLTGVKLPVEGLTHAEPERLLFGEEVQAYIQQLDPPGKSRFRGNAYLRKRQEQEQIVHLREDPTLFRRYGVPAFLASPMRLTLGRHTYEKGLTLNPCLSDWQFYRQLPDYEAYVAIDQFLSGVLVSAEKEAPPQTDREKLVSKGFDTKWSFRNPDPPRRKQKK